MKTIEYKTLDKSKWGPGPWHTEPDKVQWKDGKTGLPCLIVRNHGGAWCGYVGVSEGHPLYGIEYGQCPLGDKCAEYKPDEHSWCDHRPESRFEIHGGLTFSDFCGEHTPSAWEQWRVRGRSAARQEEARQFPRGDSARFLREWAGELDDYPAWVKKCEAVGICHVPEAGEPERVWWFGFDCAHSGDQCPGYRELGVGLGLPSKRGESYKDIHYAKNEVLSLARQLAGLPAPTPSDFPDLDIAA